jgi:hypothetical protein
MLMLPSGKIGAAFVGVFLIGALSGGLVTWSFTDKQLSTFMTNSNDPDTVIVERINKKYVHDYNLSPDELARIQPLIKAMAHHTTQIRHQFAMDFITAFEENHAKIAAQLDPPHREAYQAATAERDKELRAMLLIDAGTSDTEQK